VHTQYRPLRLNVGFLLSQTAGYGREFDFREEKLTIGGEISVENFTGHLILSRTAQGIVAQGDFSGQIPAECARCLKDFFTPISIHLEDLFVYPPQGATDPLLAIGEDAHLNLEPLMREYLLVNQPSRPLHSPDCKGLCPVCGIDLNEVKDHRHAEVETPAPERIRIISTATKEPVVIRSAKSKKPSAAGAPASKVRAAPQKKKTVRAKATAPAAKKKSTGGKKTAAGKKKPAGPKKKTSTKK
jgi:uncharacterized metal-binding protein YceD (DUF177 family)